MTSGPLKECEDDLAFHMISPVEMGFGQGYDGERYWRVHTVPRKTQD
jgi:hypothetical protein